MRELSAGLLAAQRAATGVPLIHLTIGGTDYSSRIRSLYHAEKPYGGLATTVLENTDGGISGDLGGKQVVIGYGFSGHGYSNTAPLWVLTHSNISGEGVNNVQLQCIDIWQKLYLLRVIGGGGVELKGTITGTFQVGMQVTGQTSGATAVVLGVGDEYIWVGKVASGPFQVGETVKADEYPAEIVVSSVTDIGGGSSPAWDGDKTVLEIIQQLCSGTVDVVLDSSDGIVDSTKPTYSAQAGTRIVDIIEDMMSYTKCAIRAGNDGKLHIFDVTSAPGSPDYEYDSQHSIKSDIRDVSLTLPNKIIVINAEQVGSGVIPYYGEASDAAAIAKFIEVPNIIFADVQSDADAAQLAASRLSRIQKEATRGQHTIPLLNCGQELFDYVKVTDKWSDITYYGWVGSIERRFEGGEYSQTNGLGGLVGAVAMPEEADYPLPNVEEPPTPSPDVPVPVGYVVPAGNQAYIADVDFTSVAYNKISWTAGTIKLADGRTQDIDAGSLTLTATHYLYCIWGNSTIQNSTSYSNAVGEDRILVAVASKGSATDVKAYVNNPFTDSILINRDKVMDGLVNELKLAAEAVTEAKIASSAVSSGKIAALAVIAGKIAANAVAAINIQASAVTADKIAAAAVTAIKIDAAAVDATKIAAGAITAAKLAAEIILTTTIKAGGGAVVIDPNGALIKGAKLTLQDANGSHGAQLYIDTSGNVRLDAAAWGIVMMNLLSANEAQIAGDVAITADGCFRPGTGLTRGVILGTNAKAEEGSFKVAGGGSGYVYTYSNGAWRANG